MQLIKEYMEKLGVNSFLEQNLGSGKRGRENRKSSLTLELNSQKYLLSNANFLQSQISLQKQRIYLMPFNGFRNVRMCIQKGVF